MTDPCCPEPDNVDPLLDRAQGLVNAGRAERAAINEARENNRRCSNVHHTFAGYQNGQPLIQPLGGKPYPARGRMITNASVVRGTPVQFLGCGTSINQMTRRRGVVEEPVTPDQVFWFVHGVGGATFINSAIALGETSIQIDYLNGDGCGGAANPDQYGLAIGVLDLQSAKTLSFSFLGAAHKFRENFGFSFLFEILVYRIDQPDTPAIVDIASYRAFVETPSDLWYESAALSARMDRVAVDNPAIVPSPATPLLAYTPRPNVAADVTFYQPGVEPVNVNFRTPPSIGVVGGEPPTIFDSVYQIMAPAPCTPIAIETAPDPTDVSRKIVVVPGSPEAILQAGILPASLTLDPGKYIIHLSSQILVNSGNYPETLRDFRTYQLPDSPPSVPGYTLDSTYNNITTGDSVAIYEKGQTQYFGTYNASNYIKMAVTGL